MAERIERHRAERPADWTTLEEPYALEEALTRIEPGDTVVLDCLTLWAANALERDGDPERVLESAASAAAVAADGRG